MKKKLLAHSYQQNLMKNISTFFENRCNKILLILTLIFLVIIIPVGHNILQEKIELTIFHTDFQIGKIEPELMSQKPYEGQFMGGLALLSSALEANKVKSASIKSTEETLDKNHHQMWLDTGNSLFNGSGDAVGQFQQGVGFVSLLNHMKLDAINLGNVELDLGEKILEKTLKNAQFQLLGVNFKDKTTNEIPKYMRPYIIKEFNQIKVAVIGVTNPLIFNYSLPQLKNRFKVDDPELTLKNTIKHLKENQVHVIIVMSGFLNAAKDLELAKKFQNDISLLLTTTRYGDHSQAVEWVGKLPIIRLPRSIKSLGVIKLTLDKNNFLVLPKKTKIKIVPLLSEHFSPDPKIMDLIEKNNPVQMEIFDRRPLGQALSDMSYETIKESSFGNFVCDILLKKFKTDVVLINSGTLRGLNLGPINYTHLIRAIPYTNRVVKLKLKGSEILNILQFSLDSIEESGLLQVAGIRLSYRDLGEKGLKLLSVKLNNGKEILPHKDYWVTTIDYIFKGGDGYSQFSEKSREVTYLESNLRDIVSDHIKDIEYVTGQIDNRIKILP